MFKEGTQAWYANEIGKLQGRLELNADWARLNGGFDIIAPRKQAEIQAQIDKLYADMVKARARRGNTA